MKSHVKKIITVFLLINLIFSLSACGGKTDYSKEILGEWYFNGYRVYNFFGDGTVDTGGIYMSRWQIIDGNILQITKDSGSTQSVQIDEITKNSMTISADGDNLTLYRTEEASEAAGVSANISETSEYNVESSEQKISKKAVEIERAGNFYGGLAEIQYMTDNGLYYGYVDEKGKVQFQFPWGIYGQEISTIRLANGNTFLDKRILLDTNGKVIQQYENPVTVIDNGNYYFICENNSSIDSLLYQGKVYDTTGKTVWSVSSEEEIRFNSIPEYNCIYYSDESGEKHYYDLNKKQAVSAESLSQEFDLEAFVNKMEKYSDLLIETCRNKVQNYDNYYIFDNGNIAIQIKGVDNKQYFVIYDSKGKIVKDATECSYLKSTRYDSGEDRMMVMSTDGYATEFYDNKGELVFSSYDCESYENGIAIVYSGEIEAYTYLNNNGKLLFDSVDIRRTKDITDDLTKYFETSQG